MLMYTKREGDKKYELYFNGDWELRTSTRGKVTHKQKFVSEEEALEYFAD